MKTNLSKILLSITLAGFMMACSNLLDSHVNIITEETIIYQETFQSSLGEFEAYSSVGDENWEFNSNGYAIMSGYVGGQNKANVAWLVSPEIDLMNIEKANVSFDHVPRYFANVAAEATVWVTTDVDAENADQATWTQLITPPFKDPGAWTFNNSGEISLNDYAGQIIRIGFKYISTVSKAGTWEIKNFLVKRGDAKVIENTYGLGTVESPFSVKGAIANQGGEKWVTGYIIGYVWSGTTTSYFFDADTCSQATNILIADGMNTYISQTMAVQLPIGAVRDGLNLVANKSLIGTQVTLYGSLENYFGVAGIRNTSFYRLANGNTGGTEPKVPLLSEPFSSSLGSFISVSVSGEERWTYNANGYAIMTGYVNGQNKANEAWLISPKVSLEAVEDARLEFDHVVRYFNNPVADATVWVSENYSGSGSPALATWTQLSTKAFSDPGSWTFSAAGPVSLKAYAGKQIYIGFKYLSTTTRAGTWEIKNLRVMEGAGEGGDPQTPNTIELCGDATAARTSLNEDFASVVNATDIALPGWKTVQVLGDRHWQGRIFGTGATEERYAQATAHNGAAANYEYWLITPPLNLDAAENKNLNFKTAKSFWNATSSLKVYVLQCVNNVTTQTELTGAYIARQSDTDNTFVPSGNIDLSSFSGIVYIGFQYIAQGGASNSTTFRVDDVVFNNAAASQTAVTISSSAAKTAYIDKLYTYNITTQVANPSGATVITATGIPSWATFTDQGNGTAVITGTPQAEGTYEIEIAATNNSVTATQAFTLEVTEAPDPGANLVVNGSFEEWADNKPVGWTNLSTSVTGSVNSAETGIVKEGTRSFKLDAAGASGNVNWSQTIPVTAGKKYQLSMSYYIQAGDGTDARIWSNFKKGDAFLTETELQNTGLFSLLRGPGNTNNSGSLYFPDVKGSWRTYTIEFTAPADVTAFDFQFRTYRLAVVYWDDFSLLEIE